MKQTLEGGTTGAPNPNQRRMSPNAFTTRRVILKPISCVIAAALTTLLTGCLGFLKPASSVTRHFVLTPLPAGERAPASSNALALGISRVKLPPYLFDTSLAVRRGTNEIAYLPSVLWAERLDSGFQRVLAANLSVLLPTDQIRLSAWRSDEVSAEVHVAIEQFDVDASGRGVLRAWWRVLSPGGEKILKAGETRLARPGPSPDTEPSGAIGTLSHLTADFSRQLTHSLMEATAAAGAVH